MINDCEKTLHASTLRRFAGKFHDSCCKQAITLIEKFGRSGSMSVMAMLRQESIASVAGCECFALRHTTARSCRIAELGATLSRSCSVKHFIGIGLVLATALVLRFRFRANAGFTYWTNDAPTRIIPFNTVAFWILLVAACAWFLWVGTTFIIRRLQ
jgi:hypothetical protein